MVHVKMKYIMNFLLEINIKYKSLFLIKSASTIPDECMEVGLEISTSDILGNELSENRSGRLRRNPTNKICINELTFSRRYSQFLWRQRVKRVEL